MHVLIDTDPGIDDALALVLALASPEASIEGITTVAGNVDVEQATVNLARILAVANASRVAPIAKGAAAPIARSLVTATHVHGDDGLGNLDQSLDAEGRPRYPAPDPVLEMRDGPDLILDLARRFEQALVVVALGPLTNLAIALERDRAALSRAGRIVVMGGAVAVPGNVTAAAEFNFHVDPEAAATVLGAGLPIELVPLDVTRRVVLPEAELAPRLAASASPLARFVADVTRHGFEVWTRGRGLILHDPLAVGVALDPSFVGFEDLHVVVECEGRHTLGMSLADRRGIAADRRPRPNCRVATTVDAPRFLAHFLDRLCPA
jgi:purine nucleosidase/pyrimidine-specific ribonucleoside hydrolase